MLKVIKAFPSPLSTIAHHSATMIRWRTRWHVRVRSENCREWMEYHVDENHPTNRLQTDRGNPSGAETRSGATRAVTRHRDRTRAFCGNRSEEHTSELQSLRHLV